MISLKLVHYPRCVCVFEKNDNVFEGLENKFSHLIYTVKSYHVHESETS